MFHYGTISIPPPTQLCFISPLVYKSLMWLLISFVHFFSSLSQVNGCWNGRWEGKIKAFKVIHADKLCLLIFLEREKEKNNTASGERLEIVFHCYDDFNVLFLFSSLRSNHSNLIFLLCVPIVDFQNHPNMVFISQR